jgi:transposase
MSLIKKTLTHPKADGEKRSAFCQEIDDLNKQGRPLVYVDESGFAHDMPRTHGYAIKGQRCYGSQDWGAKGRTNVIGALLAGTLLTVCLFQSTINTVIFDQWVVQDLIPKLPPRSVLILDNATFHKGKTMKQALNKAGHTLLYLPPYSPDLNPIEHKWAQAKMLRKTTGQNIEILFQKNNL